MLCLRMLRRVTLCKNRRFVVPSSLILVPLMMEALCSSETTVLKRPAPHNIPEGGILRSHRLENLKSYTILIFTKMKP
jgi:hypothetical protein